MEYTQENPLRLIELFAGIGSQTQALKNVGVPHTVVAISEIDKNSPRQTFGHIRSHAKTSRWRGMVRASKRELGADCCLKSSGC